MAGKLILLYCQVLYWNPTVRVLLAIRPKCFWFKLTNSCLIDNKDEPVENNEQKETSVVLNTAVENAQNAQHSSQSVPGIVPSAPSSVPEEETQEIIVVDEGTTELDLNHGRIGKIENLDPLKNLER